MAEEAGSTSSKNEVLSTTSYISKLQYVTTGGAVLLFLRAFNRFITHQQRGQALVGAARGMPSEEELKAELAATQKELKFYENKIKDVVQAYKNLDNEKKALEKVVATFNPETSGQEESSPATAADTLKVALADLTKEKAKREQAYISDKKALVEEVEKQKARADKLSEQLEAAQEQLTKAAKIVEKVKEQKKIIRQIGAERDKELQDHGHILAEMQKRYAEEKTRADKLSKQVAELYTKLQSNEEMPNQLKQKEAEWKAQAERMQAEISEWMKKAAVTPTMQLLQNQIENLKIDHAHALEEALSKASYGNGSSVEEEKRRRELENRLILLSEQAVNVERKSHEAEEKCAEYERQIEELQKKAADDEHHPRLETTLTSNNVEKVFKDVVELIRRERKDLNLYDMIGASQEIQNLKARYDRLENEFEKHKIKAEALLRAKNAAREGESDREDSAMRALVAQLHEKLRATEISAATDRAQHEESTRVLKNRISELEAKEENLRREMHTEMSNKVAEMEHEMQKQRNRTFEILEEKERELEITRGILLAVRGESSGHAPHTTNAPADPPQKAHIAKKKSNGELKQVERRRSSGLRHRSTDSISSAIEYYSTDNAATQLPLANESRNIYYEEELTKKDLEIKDLRSQLNHLDFRTREIEQNHLTKDLQQHEMGEKLKEEIRILEAKLQLFASGGDLEYMRNIFVQLLQSNSSAARKQILKALGMCLKLSPSEMKTIDKKVF